MEARKVSLKNQLNFYYNKFNKGNLQNIESVAAWAMDVGVHVLDAKLFDIYGEHLPKTEDLEKLSSQEENKAFVAKETPSMQGKDSCIADLACIV